MPIPGSSNSAANKDMMATTWTNGDSFICLSRKHCDDQFLLFPQCFQEQSVVDLVEANFLSGVFLPLTSAEPCEKSSRWLWKEKLY